MAITEKEKSEVEEYIDNIFIAEGTFEEKVDKVFSEIEKAKDNWKVKERKARGANPHEVQSTYSGIFNRTAQVLYSLEIMKRLIPQDIQNLHKKINFEEIFLEQDKYTKYIMWENPLTWDLVLCADGFSADGQRVKAKDYDRKRALRLANIEKRFLPHLKTRRDPDNKEMYAALSQAFKTGLRHPAADSQNLYK